MTNLWEVRVPELSCGTQLTPDSSQDHIFIFTVASFGIPSSPSAKSTPSLANHLDRNPHLRLKNVPETIRCPVVWTPPLEEKFHWSSSFLSGQNVCVCSSWSQITQAQWVIVQHISPCRILAGSWEVAQRHSVPDFTGSDQRTQYRAISFKSEPRIQVPSSWRGGNMGWTVCVPDPELPDTNMCHDAPWFYLGLFNFSMMAPFMAVVPSSHTCMEDRWGETVASTDLHGL